MPLEGGMLGFVTARQLAYIFGGTHHKASVPLGTQDHTPMAWDTSKCHNKNKGMINHLIKSHVNKLHIIYTKGHS